MDDYTIYTLGMAVFGVVSAACAAWFFRLTPESGEKSGKIARAVWPGVILAFADLLWCVPQTKPLLPESMHGWLLPLVFVLTWASWMFLDYIFSRALGGFLILLAYYFLHESFSWRTPGAPGLALLCFVFGTAGIFIAGKPWLLRDWIRTAAGKPKWRYAFSGALVVFSAAFIGAAAAQLVRGKI
jgi:hypothetical protein